VQFFYVLKKYLVNFLIVLVSLSFLYSVVDIMFSISKIPNSSNLFILYFYYVFIYAITLLYPLAFIFSFLLTLNQMIKFNELVSFYSLGFRPKEIIKPIILFNIFFMFLMFLLLSTKLAYSSEYAQAIKDAKKLTTKNIFLKYNDFIIYIESLNPVLKKAYNVYVFKIKNRDLKEVIFSKEAYFKENNWFSKNALVLTLEPNKWQEKNLSLFFLKNFKPKIISNLQKLRDISFTDAYLTIKYFKNIDKNKIFSITFFEVFTPLSIIGIIYIVFYLSPIHIRISNVTIFMLKSIAFAIFIWGGMLLIYKFAKQGVFPFYVLSFPFFVILIIDLFIRRKYEF